MVRTASARTNTAIVISSSTIVGLILVLALQFALHFNWETFLPDLLVGLATGLVVGLVLARSQARAERALDRRDMKHAWLALRPRVATEMDPLTYRTDEFAHSDFSAFVDQFDDLEELLREKPLGVWAEELNNPELSLLRDFIRTFPPLRARTDTAKQTLASQIATHLHLHNGFHITRAMGIASRQLMGMPQSVSGLTPEERAAWLAGAIEVFTANPIYHDLIADIQAMARTAERASSTMGQ